MVHATITGWAEDSEGQLISIAESGKLETMIKSVQWYAENMVRSGIYIVTENEGD